MVSRFRKLITILRTPYYRRALLKYRVAAAVKHDDVLHRIGGELKTVVDIGANRGQFALAGRCFAPGARIILLKTAWVVLSRTSAY